MTILHGDDRIYNNIFIQHYPVTDPEKTPADNDYQVVGTAPFDIFPAYEDWIAQFDFENEPVMHKLGEAHFGHLPVWVEGNAYFGGATVCKHETKKLENTQDQVTVEFIHRDGVCTLKTNVYDFLGDFKDGIITSDILGKAFEPEQRFENPDGSAIIFDADFFGDHRGIDTIPGPFAEGKDTFKLF